MSYKIVRITTLYGEYLKQYRLSYPDIQNTSYNEQYTHLVCDSYDTASSISKNLIKIGVEAHDIFSNFDEIQKRWREENNCDKTGKALLLEQIKSLQPDVVWIDNISLIDSNWVATVRNTIKSVKIITGLVCAPYNSADLNTLKSFDFVVACTPGLVKEIQKSGRRAFLIYHGFDTDILKKITIDNDYPKHDLLFTGSLYVGGGFHNARIEYLENILRQNLPIKIYGGADSTQKIVMKMAAHYAVGLLLKMGRGKWVSHIPVLNRYETYGYAPVKFYSRRLRKSLFQPVYGLNQFKLLSNAKVCFNIHGEIANRCAGNLRLFEATGLGACLITDWKDNLSDLFEPEKEVITYKSLDECITKIKWLLNNPSEAEKIGKAGQVRTLRDHTIENRVNRINELLINELK